MSRPGTGSTLGMMISLLFFPFILSATPTDAEQSKAYRWTTLTTTPTGLHAQLHISRIEADQDNEGIFVTGVGLQNDGTPLPLLTRWIAVPNNLALEVEVSPEGWVESGLVSPGHAGLACEARIGEPFTLKGIRLFPVAIPVGRVDESGVVQTAEVLNITARFSGEDSRARGADGPIRVTAEGMRFLQANVMNLDEIDIQVVAPVGRLLIVGRSNLQTTLEPYITWKRQQGYKVVYASPTSQTSTAIKSLVQSHYNLADELPLDYILMVGDHDGGLSMPGYNPGGPSGSISDHYYTMLDGGNILADVAIGRFSAQTNTELVTAISKTIAYERDVYLANPGWLNKASLAAGSGSGISPIQTNRSLKWMFGQHEIPTDTMWYTMAGGDGAIPSFIINSINAGTHFVNYRGYIGMSGWTNSNLNSLNNGTRLPVVVTITCGTGSWGTQSSALSEGFLRAGTPSSPRGAVACIGTGTISTHTRFNNIVDAGIFSAMTLENIRSLGWALVHGKNQLYNAYVGTGDASGVNDFSYWNNLMGDPALRVWLGVPQAPTVTHESVLPLGRNYIDVEVDLPGEWPDLIWATLATPAEVVDSRRLGSDGHVRLYIGDDVDLDDLMLTVVGDNVVPYQSPITSSASLQYVAVQSFTIDDGGTGDGVANPGETLDLTLVLENFGTAATGQLNATLSSDDERIEIVNGSTLTIPGIAAGGTAVIEGDVTVSIPEWVKNGSVPELLLTVGGNQISAIPIQIVSYAIEVASQWPEIDPEGDGRVMPGETADLYVDIVNRGSVNAAGLVGQLSSPEPWVTTSSTACSFGTVGVGQTRDNSTPFEVTIEAGTPLGRRFTLILDLVDASGATDQVRFEAYVGDFSAVGATGPDRYGYWAVDNTDTQIPSAPEYEWVDIATTSNRLNLNDTSDQADASMVIPLPFPFSYYGQTYTTATVCTNGWIAMGECPSIILFRNWPIPNPLGPPAMIAPYWDDLRTNNGGVYTSYDEVTGRFIVTWVCRTTNGNNQFFQAILYDTAYWPTSTGNGRILFQYNQVSLQPSASSDNDYATIGIESPDQLDGIEYGYWQRYAPGAASLTAGRAILFSDDVVGTSGFAHAEVSPDEFDVTLVWGTSEIDSVQLTNIGEAPLTWSLAIEGGEVGISEWSSRLGVERQVVSTLRPLRRDGTGANPSTASRKRESSQGSGTATHGKRAVEKEWSRLDDVIPLLSTGGPDEFGYVWVDSNEPGGPASQWHEEIGEALDPETVLFGDPDDDFFPAIDLPFVFPFYEGDYSQLWINTNGFVTFNGEDLSPDSTWRNLPMPSEHLPHYNTPRAFIAPWWDDLDLERGGSIHVHAGQNDTLVVTWVEMPGWGSTTPRGGPYTFQLVLLASGTFYMNYAEMGSVRLDEATIGFQNEDGTQGMTIVHNAAYVVDGLTVRTWIPRIWLLAHTTNGVVLADQTRQARFTVTAQQVMVGQYEGALTFLLNDPDLPQVSIPVGLTVVAGGLPPVVSNIPNQSIDQGEFFASINLDDYVTDEVWADNRISWTVTGATDLAVGIAGRVVTIHVPMMEWEGSETLTFTATNPEGLSDSDQATFTVIAIDNPPGPFSLMQPANESVVSTVVPTFEWRESVDPEGGEVLYKLSIESDDVLVHFDDLTERSLEVDLAAEGLPVAPFQEYTWSVIARDTGGHETPSNESYSFTMYDLAVDEQDILPREFAVSELYPNPFNPITSLRVALPSAAPVRMTVFDVLGRKIAEQEHGLRPAGYHHLQWGDRQAASGIYFIVVEAGPVRVVKKAVLMK